MSTKNTRLGIVYMTVTMAIFAAQDGISRHLADEYHVLMVVMIRYWFFAAFVVALASRKPGGLRAAATSQKPLLQIGRALLLAVEINVMVVAFVLLGLVEAHAIFASYPLIVAALSGPVLGEQVGWRRWVAIGVGFVGVMVILAPGLTVFAPGAMVAVVAAMMFALYSLLTRYVAHYDSPATSFFYTGTVGMVAATVTGVWAWEPMTAPDWAWMALLCVTGATGHFMLIKTYDTAEASAVQPFAYFQLVFASTIGLLVFGETVRLNVALGAAIVVSAGLFTLWRESRRARAAR